MQLIKIIKLTDIRSIAESVKYRTETFEEDLETAVIMVLMNYGDKFGKVRCIKGEWYGVKNDLERREGVPLCPNGHPLLELPTHPRLALIEEV